MNEWLVAAFVLAIGFVPCGIVVVTGRTMDRLVALELAGVIASLLLVLLAEGFSRPSLYDLALTTALLSLPGGLVFTHFLERWL